MHFQSSLLLTSIKNHWVRGAWAQAVWATLWGHAFNAWLNNTSHSNQDISIKRERGHLSTDYKPSLRSRQQVLRGQKQMSSQLAPWLRKVTPESKNLGPEGKDVGRKKQRIGHHQSQEMVWAQAHRHKKMCIHFGGQNTPKKPSVNIWLWLRALIGTRLTPMGPQSEDRGAGPHTRLPTNLLGNRPPLQLTMRYKVTGYISLLYQVWC